MLGIAFAQPRLRQRKPTTMWRASCAALAFLLVLKPASKVDGSPADEVTRRDYAIANFKPPPRWELLPPDRLSYPQLLASASRGLGKERAVITLVGQRLRPGATLDEFVQETKALTTRPRIKVQNLRVQLQPASAWLGGQRAQLDANLIEAGNAKQPQVLRQYLFMNAPFGYVLTLLAPQEQAAGRYRDLEDVLSNLVALPPSLPVPPKPPDAGTTDAGKFDAATSGPQGS